jgi:hypothetical protein
MNQLFFKEKLGMGVRNLPRSRPGQPKRGPPTGSAGSTTPSWEQGRARGLTSVADYEESEA